MTRELASEDTTSHATTTAADVRRPRPKRKGRPVEPPTDDLKKDQRRARIREATRAFRSRTASHVQELEQQVDTLQVVVEGLSETLVGIHDALDRSGYLWRHLEIAKELREAMQKFIVLTKVAHPETDDADDRDVNVDVDVEELDAQELGEPFLGGAMPSSSGSACNGGSNLRLISPHPVTSTELSEQIEQGTSQNGSFSPRLSYGVWSALPDPSLTPRATTNVMHYIMAGHDSFAARLYWNSLTLGFRSLRGDEDYLVGFAKSMFRYKLRYTTPQQVLKVLGYVLNQMLLGTSNVTFDQTHNKEAFAERRPLPDLNASGAVDTNAVKNAIHRDIIQEGGAVDDYLDTWGVERYLANRWQMLVDSSIVRPLQRNLVLDVEPLLNSIAAAAVTIGEGPRYATQEIDMAVESFLAQARPAWKSR